MANPNLSGLTSQQDQSIQHLEQLIADSENWQQFLSKGLEWITSTLEVCEGAILLNNSHFVQNPIWIGNRVPTSWRDQVQLPDSELSTLIRRSSLESISMEGVPKFNISVMLPIQCQGETLGVLILGGSPLDAAALQNVHFLASVVTFMLESKLSAAQLQNVEKRDKVIQSFALSMSELTSDPDLTLFNLLQGIRGYFKAEYLLYIQSDPETPELLIKKMLADGDEWLYQISQHLSAETLNKLVNQEGSTRAHILPVENNPFQEICDFPDVAIRSMLFSPILSRDNKCLGALILINSDVPIGPSEIEIFTQYAMLAAGTIENLVQIQKMKVSLARLESKQMDLINSRNILREMFDNILISIYIINDSYTIQAVNKARSSRTSIPPRQLVGKTCYEVLGGRNSPCPSCKVCETFAQGKNTSRPYRQWIASESYVEWEISTHPIFNDMHTPIMAIIQEVDMTEKRNLEANLIQSEKLAAVGQLAAGVAHEINNPLSAIIANAQIMLQENPDNDPDTIESLKLIETAGIRASNVVRNLLSISHKENQTFTNTDINETINGALLLIQHELVKHPISVDPQLDPNLPTIKAQQDHLQGVWINLFMNAIDAIVSTGRPDGKLRIKTALSGSDILITISDNGKGIEPNMLTKIFEPFYTTKSVGHGTGLGLSVCARTIKEHQGSITVISQPNEGSKFTITLPVKMKSEDN